MATWPGWEGDVLRAIGAPTTAANVAFLDTWQRYEGGSAAFNPLNTTQNESGATDYNSVGVKNYPSAKVGAKATASTLTNGFYPDVVAALRSGNPQPSQAVEAQIRTWGTSGFADALAGGTKPARGSSSGQVAKSSGSGSFTGRSRPTSSGGGGGGGGGGITGAIEQGVATAALGPLGGVFEGLLGNASDVFGLLKAVMWLFSPTNWLRMVEFLTGMLLLASGVIGLAAIFLSRNDTVRDAATTVGPGKLAKLAGASKLAEGAEVAA